MELRTGTPEEAGMSSRRIQHVRELASSWVEDGITPALVVLAARRGVIVLDEAYGRLNPEVDSPVLQRDSIFPLASITKPITATAVMALVEDGLLGLNRPVQSYIPEFQGDGKDAVLVHHLLTHTSGLDVGHDLSWLGKKRDDVGLPPGEKTQHPNIHADLIANYEAPLAKKPGDEMSYCNFNYALLGEIVRRLSGQSLASFATKRIFEPLGMNDTHFIVPDSVKSRIVKRPPDSPYAIWDEDWVGDTPHAAVGVFSTAQDIVIFGQMFLNGGSYWNARILSAPSVSAMTRNQIPGVSADYAGEHHDEALFGYGWVIYGGDDWRYFPGTLMSPKAFNHPGSGGVFLWIDPTYELVGVYFSATVEMIDEFAGRNSSELFVNTVIAAIDD